LQLANEPDLSVLLATRRTRFLSFLPSRSLKETTSSLFDRYKNRRRDGDYTFNIWETEMQSFFSDVVVADPKLPQSKNWYLPNVCCK